MAAILAADVAGSSRLMGVDEEGTLAKLKSLRRALFDPKVVENHGRVVKNTGDGALAEFASVVDAVRCAVEIQRGMAEKNTDVSRGERIELRIGIHLGDIIVDENDIYGDGVNVAVRLEGIAEPGGVSISDDAYRQIRGKVDFIVEDIGWRSLKNIANPMRVWRIQISGAARSVAPRTSRMTRRLAAILVADVAGFTSLVKADETVIRTAWCASIRNHRTQYHSTCGAAGQSHGRRIFGGVPQCGSSGGLRHRNTGGDRAGSRSAQRQRQNAFACRRPRRRSNGGR